jgi:hypothetical protein
MKTSGIEVALDQIGVSNESENIRKRSFIKFGQPQRSFLGICKTVQGVQIRWLVCLISYFFSFVFFKEKAAKRFVAFF